MKKKISIYNNDFQTILETHPFTLISDTGATIIGIEDSNGVCIPLNQVKRVFLRDENKRYRFHIDGVVRKTSVSSLKGIKLVYDHQQPDIPLKDLDMRYKVTQEDVLKMRAMRKQGYSYQAIADAFNVSFHTAYYWLKSDYRKYKQEINAKRKRTDPAERHARVVRQIQERALKRNLNQQYRLACDYVSMKSETRTKRKTSKGRSFKQLQKEYEEGKSETSQKVF